MKICSNSHNSKSQQRECEMSRNVVIVLMSLLAVLQAVPFSSKTWFVSGMFASHMYNISKLLFLD